MRQDNNNKPPVSLWREALVAMSLGWDLAIPIFAGVIIGYFIDRWLGTRYIFTLGLLVLGISISFYNLALFIQRQDRQSELEGSKKQKSDDSNG